MGNQDRRDDNQQGQRQPGQQDQQSQRNRQAGDSTVGKPQMDDQSNQRRPGQQEQDQGGAVSQDVTDSDEANGVKKTNGGPNVDQRNA